MGLFDIFREDPDVAASRERMRRDAQAEVRRIEGEIADLDRRHATQLYPDPQAHRAIRRRLETNLGIARANLRAAG